MPQQPEFDLQAAHKFFSAHCFNSAWDLIDKKDRTEPENQQMITLCQASIWHWTQRDDCTDKNLSIGYWQASRIYALLGRVDPARKYAQLSLDHAQGGEACFVGYAYEALARAEAVAGDAARRDEYLTEANKIAADLTDEESRKMLETDLATIG